MIPVQSYLVDCVLIFHPEILSQTRSYGTPGSGIIPDLLLTDLEDVALGPVVPFGEIAVPTMGRRKLKRHNTFGASGMVPGF